MEKLLFKMRDVKIDPSAPSKVVAEMCCFSVTRYVVLPGTHVWLAEATLIGRKAPPGVAKNSAGVAKLCNPYRPYRVDEDEKSDEATQVRGCTQHMWRAVP